MRLGLKRIFSRRKSRAEKIARSPKEKETPDTPPTQPVKEDVGEGRDDGSQAYSVELPVKNLLDDLNISEDNGRGDTELVLKLTDVPDDEPPMEPPYFGQGSERLDSEQEEDDAEAEKDTKTEELESHEEQAEKTTEAGKSKEPGESSSTVQFEDSPLRPRQLEPSGDLEIASDDGSLTEPAADQLVEKQVVRGASKDEQDATADMTKQVSRTLFGFYEKAKECASGVLHPEPSVRELVVPTADNALCQPIGRTRTRSGLSANRPRLLRQYSYYDEQFALKILDEMINVGYALVNHQQLIDDATDEGGDWVGRSVTLILRPGICNTAKVQAPYLEWATLGGGQRADIETTAVSLVDIHSIATCTAEDMAIDEDEEGNVGDEEEVEDLQCFFSLTTKQGQIHVMEAITADESQRLVAGVKNLASRLANQVISGDKAVLSDFFDNSQETEEIRVTEEEAMIQVSHSFLDHVDPA